MAAITVSQLPTAEEDPDSWNTIRIAGQVCPGTCLPVDGERRRGIDHDKSKGSSKDLLVDNGLDPTEGSIRIRTIGGDQFRALYDFYLKYMDPDRVPSRLNVVTIAHPQFYARGIKMGYFYNAPVPKPTAEAGIRPYIHEFRFRIVGPKTQIGSASKSSKPRTVTANVVPSNYTPQYGVVNAVSAIGIFNLVDPTFTGPPSPVPVQELQLYTPQELQQLGDNGNVSARFAAGLPRNAAP